MQSAVIRYGFSVWTPDQNYWTEEPRFWFSLIHRMNETEAYTLASTLVPFIGGGRVFMGDAEPWTDHREIEYR